MFVAEAEWIGNQLRGLHYLPRPLNCLNLGSSTREYRELYQPHIHQHIFEPLLKVAEVTHVDIKAADGVDIAGDFMDEAFWEKLPANAYNLVMCCNLLTHVTHQNQLYKLIHRSVAPGGYVVISTPQLYPYCADPLDTKYRPSQDDILGNFSSFEIIAITNINLSDTHFSRMRDNPKTIVSFLVNILLPIKGLARWKAVVTDIPNIFKPLSSICLILRAPKEIRSKN
jgi:SAM-dependent methyltransferase